MRSLYCSLERQLARNSHCVVLILALAKGTAPAALCTFLMRLATWQHVINSAARSLAALVQIADYLTGLSDSLQLSRSQTKPR